MTSEMGSMCRRPVLVSALAAAALVVTTGVVAAQTPSPALLVMLRSAKAKGTMAIVDPKTNKIVAEVRTGEDPHGVTASSDGKLAFAVNVSGPDGNSLSVIDLAARKELRRVQLEPGTRPHDIQFANGKAYFTTGGRGPVARYDPAKNEVEYLQSTEKIGTRMMTLTKDMNTIFATSQSTKSVVAVEGISGPISSWKVTVIPLPNTAEGIDITPDGKEVWTANRDGAACTIIDVATKKVIGSVEAKTDHANRIGISPDGKHALLLDREIGVLMFIDIPGRKLIKQMKMAGSDPSDVMGLGDIVMAPDGSRGYVTVQDTTKRPAAPGAVPPAGHHYVAVIDLKTLEIAARIPTP